MDAEAVFAEIDDWCKNRCDKLREKMDPYIMDGGDLDAAEYRRQLGQHQAYMAMRSYLHGAVRALLKGE